LRADFVFGAVERSRDRVLGHRANGKEKQYDDKLPHPRDLK
jgi:hypothetical protein